MKKLLIGIVMLVTACSSVATSPGAIALDVTCALGLAQVGIQIAARLTAAQALALIQAAAASPAVATACAAAIQDLTAATPSTPVAVPTAAQMHRAAQQKHK